MRTGSFCSGENFRYDDAYFDDYSKFIWLYHLKKKSDFLCMLFTFITTCNASLMQKFRSSNQIVAGNSHIISLVIIEVSMDLCGRFFVQ